MGVRNPWVLARERQRDYITPEDITECIRNGASRERLQRIVLAALGVKRCEDWSLCAFIAARGPYRKATRP